MFWINKDWDASTVIIRIMIFMYCPALTGLDVVWIDGENAIPIYLV